MHRLRSVGRSSLISSRTAARRLRVYGLADLGAIVTPLNAKDFAAYMQSETVKWADVVKQAGLKFE